MCGIREGGIREGLLVWEACVAYARVARKKRPDVLAAAGSASFISRPTGKFVPSDRKANGISESTGRRVPSGSNGG